MSISFADKSNGTILDSSNDLMWQKCSSGLVATDCSGTAASSNWKDALAYCEALSLASKTNWRLPSARELQSIVKYDLEAQNGPYVNATYFPGTNNGIYWSSTVKAKTPTLNPPLTMPHLIFLNSLIVL